jgi:hypothetical protein
MAGKVVVSTLNNDTGVLATQNGMTGIAKAWVNFNGTGTPVIRDSFNVASITKNGTGDYYVNFTTAMPNVNYSVAGVAMRDSANTANLCIFGNSTYTTTFVATTQVRMNVRENTNQSVDGIAVCVSVFSS